MNAEEVSPLVFAGVESMLLSEYTEQLLETEVVVGGLQVHTERFQHTRFQCLPVSVIYLIRCVEHLTPLA
jgi:hypothetical protein